MTIEPIEEILLQKKASEVLLDFIATTQMAQRKLRTKTSSRK